MEYSKLQLRLEALQLANHAASNGEELPDTIKRAEFYFGFLNKE